MARARASFLLTVDVHDHPALPDRLNTAVETLLATGIGATFFIPGSLVARHRLESTLRRLIGVGHQVACHGLAHEPPEDLATDPFEKQVSCLRRAKDALENATGGEVTTFRAPAFRLSTATLLALETTGYRIDCSVTPQRLPLLSSQPGNVGWIRAPRVPYHPDSRDPFRRGELRLVEIPTTCFVVPYSSMILWTLGERFARAFTAVAITEARLLQTPIVYLAHLEDFNPSDRIRPPVERRLSHLLPSPNGGVLARYWFYERDESRMYELGMRMLRFLAGLEGIDFMTVDDWVRKAGAATRQRPSPVAAVAPTSLESASR